MKVIKAIYNFLVGDMAILIGVILIMALLALLDVLPVLAPLKIASGVILVAGVLIVLLISLQRETREKH